MGFGTFVSHKVERSELEAGDHIYTWRVGFSYAHHGIYVGEDRVVNFTHQNSWIASSSVSFSQHHTCKPSSTDSFPDCGFKKGESGVTISCLDGFLRQGSLYRYKYEVRRRVCMSKVRGGTCTIAKCDDPEAVIHRAMYLLENGFVKYNLFKKNCEDFALYCKTGLVVHPGKKGLGCSGQVWYAFGGFVPPVRYFMDIGVRGDVEKVQVEDLATFLANECDD